MRWSRLPLLLPGLLAVSACAASAASAADASRAEEIAQGQCFVCHGIDGESSTPIFPRLAGQHAEYVARQLADFKSGRRNSPVMQPLAKELTPGEMLALGRWYESRPVQAHAPSDPALLDLGRAVYEQGVGGRGVPACKKCHGQNGEGTDTLPRLAGQHATYLENQLRAFSKKERTNDNALMQNIAARISDVELRAVSSYMSGLK